MRRFFAIFLFAVCAISCDMAGTGSGGEFENPLDQCVIPSEVWAGGEGIIQWNGFKDEASLLLVSADAGEYALENVKITPSGVSFMVPVEVPEGQYALTLAQDGRTELGMIHVHARKAPVYGVKVPSSAFQGETVSVRGIGFSDGCTIVFVGVDGQEYRLETLTTSTGVSVVIPEEIAEGEYHVYLLQDGIMWLLARSFDVYAKAVIKELRAVSYSAPYSGTARMVLEWTISRQAPAALQITEYVIDGSEVEMQAYDLYVSDGERSFVLEHDGFEMSNDMSMAYEFNGEGAVVAADVLLYGKSSPTRFAWTYDSDGYLVDISSPKASFRAFGYEEGNLTLFRNTQFEYDSDGLVNNPYACDVVWGYMALMEKDDPFMYVPYLMGWYAKASHLLPARMASPSPQGTGTIICPLSYEFDADGYVTAMYWEEGKDFYRVEYVYEAM